VIIIFLVGGTSVIFVDVRRCCFLVLGCILGRFSCSILGIIELFLDGGGSGNIGWSLVFVLFGYGYVSILLCYQIHLILIVSQLILVFRLANDSLLRGVFIHLHSIFSFSFFLTILQLLWFFNLFLHFYFLKFEIRLVIKMEFPTFIVIF
jgi:hypothetical protein